MFNYKVSWGRNLKWVKNVPKISIVPKVEKSTNNFKKLSKILKKWKNLNRIRNNYEKGIKKDQTF